MEMKRVIENALVSNNLNLVITQYGMTSDSRDESFQQTVRISFEVALQEQREKEDQIFKEKVIPAILHEWAGAKSCPAFVNDVMQVHTSRKDEFMDILIIQNTDGGYYISRTFNGMF